MQWYCAIFVITGGIINDKDITNSIAQKELVLGTAMCFACYR
jgi:hypothetical protein